MGAAVGAVLRARGHRVVWASEGRSDETRARARAAGLEDVGSPAEVARSEVVFSICPPHAALDVARLGLFAGIYVDANAISPARVREVVQAAGGDAVDGGIVGSPPRESGTTRFYLSGPNAAAVAELFAGSVLDARVVSDEIGDASAVKMAYAGWTKGTAAMLLAIRELARVAGAEETMRDGAAAFHAGLDAIPENLPATEKIREALRSHLRVVADQLDVATVFVQEWRYLEGDRRDEILSERRRYEERIKALFREGRELGELRSDLDDATGA